MSKGYTQTVELRGVRDLQKWLRDCINSNQLPEQFAVVESGGHYLVSFPDPQEDQTTEPA